MSIRGSKRAMGARAEEAGAGASKRRKTEQEDVLWRLRPVSDLKIASIYNRSASEAPAELFRKDLISAMKIADSEALNCQEYWIITDAWKQEWERGVQVPVNPDSLPAPMVHEIENPLPPNFQEFKLPKNKYIHLNRDASYQAEIHQLSTVVSKAEAACKYDLDAVDSAWLKILNGERARAGATSITEDQLERVIQELELRCCDKIQAMMKSEEGLGIEFDENVICDVCRSPDSEEGNEMVFCDACNICVHQACYGITTIPSGQWLCRPCGDRVRPSCVLCPNLGGAMKCTPSGHKWAHVSCVLWIPEVSIGCAEKMEPITKISAIPSSRWSLLCVLCRERKGACIQCSVKTCKTAYHVTCAFKHGLEMRAIIEDENADDGVKLRSYCQKHSVNSKKEKNSEDNSEEDEVKRKRRKDMTSEEKSQARAMRLHEIESEFDKHVSIKDISTHLLDIDQDAIGYIYSYWKLKRRAGHNRPLLPSKIDDSDLLSHRQEQADLDKMKMFVQLRQDLERVRNLCYMVSRREKLSRTFFRMREQTFHKQVAVLSEQKDLNPQVVAAVVEANHGPSIYDRMYSHPEASDNTNDFEAMMARIAEIDSEDDKKDYNGLFKSRKMGNPYKKAYVNGSTRRSGSMFSGMSSEESAPEISRGQKYNKQAIGSTTDEDEKPSKKKISPISKGKVQVKTERKKRLSTRQLVDSSSEDDIKTNIKKEKPSSRSRTLQALQREMSVRNSGTDSDDLIPSLCKGSRNNKFPVDIYSDSSEASNPKFNEYGDDKSPNATNDSTQHFPRTKAAMKQFIPVHKNVPEKPGNKRGRKSSSSKEKLMESDEEAKNKENIKASKGKEYPTDLIVPQRQAAKKASENIRSTTKPKESDTIVEMKPALTAEDTKIRSKLKVKPKEEKTTPTKEQNRKKNVSSESLDFDKDEKDQDTIAYVPQRQAAKKAAAHIKSGLGSKPAGEVAEEAKKKEAEMKSSPRKDDEKLSKSSTSSSSSSSNTSSSSCSSSSSSEDESVKSTKPLSRRQQSLFSPVAPRPSVDLPFLDKVSRPLSSSSPSSDSDTKEWQRGKSPAKSPVDRDRSRRADSSGGSDGLEHKTPDKKFKTSKRHPECNLPSPPTQREKRGGTGGSRAVSRARPRSTAPGGDLSNERDARSRKSAHLSRHAHAQSQQSEQTTDSGKSPASKWKTDKTLISKESEKERQDENKEKGKKTPSSEKPKESPKQKLYKTKKLSESSRRTSISSRRASILDTSPVKEETIGIDKNVSEFSKSSRKSSSSPMKSISPKKSKQYKFAETSPSVENTSIMDDPKLWIPPPKSPIHHTISMESYEDSDKYSEDKCMDDRSSRMIAKIQANLNENTLIKSPKTPMDATSGINDTDNETIDYRLRKPSGDIQKKSLKGQDNTQDIDSHRKNYPKRSIFSPQPMKDNPCNDFLDFGNNIMAVDDSVSDGFGNEEIMKPFSFNSEFLFKEDSKEDRGVQETLNLVEKLRMTLSSKKTVTDEQENVENSGHQAEDYEVTVQLEETEKVDEEREIADEQSSPRDSNRDAEKSQPSLSLAASNENTQDVPQELTTEPVRSATPEAMDSHKWGYPSQAAESRNVHSDYASNKHNVHHQHSQFSEHVYQDNQYKEKIYETQRYGRTFEEKQYDEKHYERLQYDGKQYDEKQYEEKQYGEKQYAEKQYDEKQYDEKQYDEKQYDERQYADKTYAEKLYEKHSQYHPHPERQELEKSSARLQNEIQNSNDRERFMDVMSKQSDDSRSIVDTIVVSDEAVAEDGRSQSFDNNNSLPQSDCATISSPYRDDERLEGKWSESKITKRRSSASSTNSEGSVCSQKLQIKPHMQPTAEMLQEMEYANMRMHQHIHPAPHTEAIPYNTFPSEPSPYGSVSLFQPGTSTTLPFQSPGTGFYPSNLSIPYTTSMISNLPKPFTSMCSAFTPTSQNLTLNAPAAPPVAPKAIESPPDDMDLSTEKSYSRQPSPSPSADSFNDTSSVKISKISNDSNDTVCTQSTVESRGSSKPMRTSSRFIGSGKSPGKSPGFSPKTVDSNKSSASKRSTSSKSSRGRGRGRSRSRGGQSLHGFSAGSADYQGTIHSKLVGTVYELDFDEETANDGVDLKSMRDRRRSVEVHDKKLEATYKDASPSPRIASSPPQVTKKISLTPDNKEIRPAVSTTIMKETPPAEGAGVPRPLDVPAFPAIVQPVLPGPVDMRRYQPLEIPSRDFQFGSFEAVATHQPLEFDEESEKELQKHLAQNPPASPPKSPIREPPEPIATFTPEPPMPKVSLSDSRNQLKVKIKGPFRDANYSATVPAVTPQPPRPTYEPPAGVLGTPSAVASASSEMLSGTSNLRRMRKKELLRQYWTQDMNMDDPAMNPPVPPPVHQSPLSRTIITIPKAVASMTTIPTREDYKAVVDANMEKKKRKAVGERELRHLQDDNDDMDDLVLDFPSFNTTPTAPPAKKARGRAAAAKLNKPSANTPVTPKLKIKIGSNVVRPVAAEEPSSGSSQFRPPKKRLQAKEVTPPKPTYEDLRRESMKFRKVMMAKFDDVKKEKKHKPKSDKADKKKKKGKKADKHEVVNSKSDSLTKLVIKISRNKEEKAEEPGPSASVDPFEYDPSAPDPLAIDPPSSSESCSLRKYKTSKVTPIRLKLARSSEGSGYVMKKSDEGTSRPAHAPDSVTDPM